MTDVTPMFNDGAAPYVEATGGIPGHTVVRLPDGSLTVVADAAIVDVPATVASEAPKPGSAAPEPEEHFYVHLANGEVRRVKQSDIPRPAGTNAPHGVWQESGKVYVITGVYPVETIVK